jgi:hypothetical protein
MSRTDNAFIDSIYGELSMPAAPSWWLLLKARLFGKHIITKDCGWVCHTVKYQGRFYVLSLKEET